MKRLAVVLCALLCVTSVFAPVAAASTGTPDVSPVEVASTGTSAASAAAPTAIEPTAGTTVEQVAESEDAPGCVDGICHNDTLSIDQSDGLSDRELERLVDRSMARVEHLRGEEFDSDIPVEVMSREEFRQQQQQQRQQFEENNTSREFNRWNDQVWKALFIIGEDQSSETAISETIGSSVQGFYSPIEDKIVIITPTPESPTISERTLIHELTHALQDQRHDLTNSKYQGDTQDEDLAITGAYEGETVYMEYLYEQRCEDGRWQCLATPPRSQSGGSDAPSNTGVLLLLLQPYSDGPAYVHEIVETEGWSGVDELLENPPNTTTEIIEREPFEATPIEVEDEATDGWQRYPEQGDDGAEVAGEASLYVMLWYQAQEYDADTIDPSTLYDAEGPYDRRNYVAPPSNGWVNDKLYPYARGEDENGYVWALEWETPQDAAQFERAYGEILAAHDANETESGVYVIEEGGFSGAYAVEVEDTRVTIVHAPTVEGVYELRPSLSPTTVIDESIPGFGPPAALLALVGLLVGSGRLTQ